MPEDAVEALVLVKLLDLALAGLAVSGLVAGDSAVLSMMVRQLDDEMTDDDGW